MNHYLYLEEIMRVLDEWVLPNMKVGVDPLDTMRHMMRQMTSSQQGTAMRIMMLENMLNAEAQLPQGMSLTRKAAGGSPTASVKREFGIKKGLSKQKTYDTFSALREVCQSLLQNRTDVYELCDAATYWVWDEEADDGSMIYTYNKGGA